MSYYDDNFGCWTTDEADREMRDWYDYVQRNSVETVCRDCGETVRLMPQYVICNSCAEAHESGWAL